ncbi:MAG: hypothetical protein HY922_17455 [Elusimicrobia bacterium]|nr:hypothetical protein [Elusimicrobiota bacterium]
MREQFPPDVPAGRAALAAASGEASCPVPALPPDAVIQGRIFSLATIYDIKSGEKILGTVSAVKNGYAWRDASGALVAVASESKVEDGRLVSVADCAGSKIGEIAESDAPKGGGRSFDIRDAQGRAVAASGPVDFLQSRIALRGQGAVAAEMESIHWFLDRWVVRIPAEGADPRLVSMVIAYNSEANARESAHRRHERRRRHGHHGHRGR